MAPVKFKINSSEMVPPAVTPGDLNVLSIVGSNPLLLWAVYLHQTTVRHPGPVALLRKIGYWFVVGGPVAATAALLWARDEVVKEDEAPLKDKDT